MQTIIGNAKVPISLAKRDLSEMADILMARLFDAFSVLCQISLKIVPNVKGTTGYGSALLQIMA